MREIITIHVGQAGIQLGNACWELFCLEHNIQPDGFKPSKETVGQDEEAFRTFFSETSDPNRFTARSIFVDLEPEAIDHLKTGTYRELFQVDQMISGKEGANHNFGRGYCTVGRQHIDWCMDRIRKVADQCQDLQGFIVFGSLGGGTGSGLGSLLLENLSTEYNKKTRVSVPIFPSAQGSTSTVEPYNTMLAMGYHRNHADLTTIMDNEAIYGINTKRLQIEKPNNDNLNNVIAQMVVSTTGSMTSSMRYVQTLDELQTNLVPYPSIHFLSSSYAPFFPEGAKDEEMDHFQLSTAVFSADNMSIKCDPGQGKYMAANIFYRGDYHNIHICPAITHIKSNRQINFVDWCPTGVKLGMDFRPPVVMPSLKMRVEKKVASLLANSTAISQVFSRNEQEFDKMFKNRAFLHWFLSEGMEEGDFVDSQENLAALQLDYREMEREDYEEIEEDDVIGTGA